MTDEALKQAIEAIKMRLPIEDVVGERVPALRRSGSLFSACCPFHEEKTPSFKVDPRRGTWHCFGACGFGGDQISFVQRFDRLDFMPALELLAARAGVELPRRGARGDEVGRDHHLREVLGWAREVYRSELAGAEGKAARSYFERRGFHADTLAAFGIGYAPRSGQILSGRARRAGHEVAVLIEAGLARRNDQGQPYDFFRGRAMFPIADWRGHTTGFGARRLEDAGESGPKYVNSPETPLFRKHELIFGLDLAADSLRRSRHAVLVEGYTDVMAAHQVGARNVVAVLGTATGSGHARALRRAGVERLTLCFDGDEAGRRATRRALEGLLPFDFAIDVLSLSGGEDPCDFLLREGPGWLEGRLAAALDWFEDALTGVLALPPRERSTSIDHLLALVALMRQPLERDARLMELSERLGHEIESVRAAFSTLSERATGTLAEGSGLGRPTQRDALSGRTADSKRLRRAFGELMGACLLDNSLVPLLREVGMQCPEEDLASIGNAILSLSLEPRQGIGATEVMTYLADHPAREKVPLLCEHARLAESPEILASGALELLRGEQLRRCISTGVQAIAEASEADRRQQLSELYRRLRAQKIPGAT